MIFAPDRRLNFEISAVGDLDIEPEIEVNWKNLTVNHLFIWHIYLTVGTIIGFHASTNKQPSADWNQKFQSATLLLLLLLLLL